MYKISFLCLIFLFLSVSLVSSVDFIPQGNIEGLGIRRIHNFTNISADLFCDDGDNCATILELNTSITLSNFSSGDGNITYSSTTGIFTLIKLDLAEFTNSLNWITNAVSDLVNYYTKTEVDTINTSDNINNLFTDTTFHAQEINGSINSTNIKNTPTACSVTNSFMTEYAGASSTCTATDFSVINNTPWNFTDVKITESLNLTNKTISNVFNLTFQNGGGIWDNGTHICIGSC